MIRFSDIAGHPVLSTRDATTVGRVEALVIDPAERRVRALRVKRSKGPGDVLLWDGITAIGPDAVTVDTAARIADTPDDLRDRVDLDVVGRRVLTDGGRELGPVRDVEFDPADGRVTSLLLKDAFVDGDRLIGIGSWAVVVRA